jgi:hypothetical protein
VNSAIELHRQANARTVEIDDVASDPMLAAKFEDTAPSKCNPQDPFRPGLHLP